MPRFPVFALVGFPIAALLAALAVLPVASSVLLAEDFEGADGVFVSADSFWTSDDLGRQDNAAWLSESGLMLREESAGRVQGGIFRMWTRDTRFGSSRVDLDVTFDGWAGGDASWHGINLWLNASLCLPVPRCSRLDDGTGGEGGYALDFMNRDGSVTILKKVPGDSRARWPAGVISHSQGGTYYRLSSSTFRPVPGTSYRFTGSAGDDGRGGVVLQVLVDGDILLEVVDDGSTGGPPLRGERVGLRSDYAATTVDDLKITR